eukprot:4477997-Karenia_brevis.AAC.1
MMPHRLITTPGTRFRMNAPLVHHTQTEGARLFFTQLYAQPPPHPTPHLCISQPEIECPRGRRTEP